MKELIFIRHAKSDWGNEYLKDIDRHLSEKGYRDAYFMSEWFAKNKEKPALILSSTATRALNTALIFTRTLELDMNNFKLEERIYEANIKELFSVIRTQSNGLDTIMLFGHNPSFTTISNEMTDDIFFDNVPTCGIVSLQFDIKTWKEIETKKGKLNYYQFPKDFKTEG